MELRQNMTRRIAILRGVNVGGRRKLIMADLRALFEKMGFSNVNTYIQSGNVIFDLQSEIDNVELAKSIEEEIRDEFGFEVPVIVRSSDEISKIVSQNPFVINNVGIEHLHLTFLKEKPMRENCKKIESVDYRPDLFTIIDNNVYVFCDDKYHKSKLTNTFFEKKLHVAATTRNWKTVLKLLKLSEE